MRVLALRALGLGDFLTGVPAYRAIRRAYPRAHIQLAAPRCFSALLDLMEGTIDEIVDHSGVAALPERVRGADFGIDLHGRGPDSHHALVQSGVRDLVAFCHAEVPASCGGPRFDDGEHEVARWCRLLGAFGIEADAAELDLEVPRASGALRLPQGTTLVHPGAASEARRWPAERWVEVVAAERARGREVVLTGSAGEAALAHGIARGAGVTPAHVYAGRTSLRELAALVASAERVVCGDTGVAHLATAFRRPSVLLFGPTSPAAWGPPPRPYHRVLWSGAIGDPHASRVDPGLAAIEAADVVAALAALPLAPATARMSRATA